MLIKEALLWGWKNLQTQEPHLDANADSERLLEFVLKNDKTHLYLNLDKSLRPGQKLRYQSLIKKRAKLYPLAYLLGEVGFYNLTLKITPGVFVPRPETELLVEEILKILKSKKISGTGKTISIAEIGIGSGAIAVTLLHNAADKISNYYANDLSFKARRNAAANARQHKVSKKLKIIAGKDVGGLAKYNCPILIANPPYVPYKKYQQSVTVQAEPWRAITDKNDGLDFFRRLVIDLKNLNYYPELIALEFDEDTTAALLKVLKPLLKKYSYKIHQDWQGLDRFLILKLKKSK